MAKSGNAAIAEAVIDTLIPGGNVKPNPVCLDCAEFFRGQGIYREEDDHLPCLHVTRCYRCGYDFRGQLAKNVFWFYLRV